MVVGFRGSWAWTGLGVLGGVLMLAACSGDAVHSTGADQTSGSTSESSSDASGNGASTEGTGGSGTTSGSAQTGGSGGTGGSDASGGSGGACLVGDERCDCYPNDTCNGSLRCLSGLCVDAGMGGSGGDNPQGSGGSGGGGSGGDTTSQSSGGGDTSTATTGGTPPDPLPEASCESPVAACGGDVVGTWTVAASCLEVTGEVDVSLTGLGCLEASAITGTVETSGTLTLEEDGTVLDETSMSGDATFELADDCLMISGTTTTCDRVGGPLASIGFSSVQCVANEAGGCSCTASYDQMYGLSYPSYGVSTTATYVTAGNTLTISYRSVDVEHDYCVDGSVMHLNPQSVSQAGTVIGEIALWR